MSKDSDKTHMNYSHDVLELVKIKYTIDGDLAATISNAFAWLERHNLLFESDIIFCDHTEHKLFKFLEKLGKEIDIENKVEK